MPIVSIKKGILGSGILKKAAGSTPKSYTPKKLENFLKREKTFTPYGSITYKRLFEKNQTMDKKKFEEMYELGQKEGVFGKFYSAGDQFNKAVREEKKQQLIDKQIEQKNQTEKKQAATIKPKEENITQSRRFSAEGDRRRQLLERGLIRKEDQVYEAGKEFRDKERIGSGVQKEQEKKYNIGMRTKFGGKSEGLAEGKGGLVGHAVEEEKKDEKSSPKGSKSGQKGGGSAPAGQKSSGNQPPRLQSSAGFEKLTRSPETSSEKNIPTGGIQVKELENKLPASQPETSPSQKPDPVPVSAPKDITDMDI